LGTELGAQRATLCSEVGAAAHQREAAIRKLWPRD